MVLLIVSSAVLILTMVRYVIGALDVVSEPGCRWSELPASSCCRLLAPGSHRVAGAAPKDESLPIWRTWNPSLIYIFGTLFVFFPRNTLDNLFRPSPLTHKPRCTSIPIHTIKDCSI